MKILVKILITVFVLMTGIGCGNNGKKNDPAEDTQNEYVRRIYEPEKNPVEVIKLEKKTFNKEMVSNGRLSARSKSVIGYKTAGVIETVNVDNGSYVKAGSVLGTLEMTEARNNLVTAENSFEKAKIDLLDAIIGFGYSIADTLSVPDDILKTAKIRSGYNVAELALESAKTALEGCSVIAPFSGKVADLKAKPHERTAESFCTIIDDQYMDVDFSIVESELGFVKTGQEVAVTSYFNPEISVKGKIKSINPTVTEKGQINVKAEILNNKGFIDGMNVKILVRNTVPGQLVVPKSAVVIRDNLEVLFKYDNNRALWTYVHIIMENSDSYVVSENTSRGAELSEGEYVIISGNLNLADQSEVELID